MQATEEYLDQLLASMESGSAQDNLQQTERKRAKSLEEIEDSELTEEVLQKQLSLLLGLEKEEDEDREEEGFSSYHSGIETFSDNEEDVFQNENARKETDATETVEAEESKKTSAALVEESVSEERSENIVPEKEIPVSDAIAPEEMLSIDEINRLLEEQYPELAGASDEEAVTEEIPLREDTRTIEEVLLAAEQMEQRQLEDDIDNQNMDSLLAGWMMPKADTEEILEEPAEMIAQRYAEAVEENLVEASESHIQTIPDFGFEEEMLLDMENVDAMLSATAKLAEMEAANAERSDAQAEEDILTMLAQFEEESEAAGQAAQEESARAAEAAVQKALSDQEEAKTQEADSETVEKKKKRREKKKKEKKEKATKGQPIEEKSEKPIEEKPEKKSLKSKIFAFMFEEDSEEDASADADGMVVSSQDAAFDELTENAGKKVKKEKKNKKASKQQSENDAIAAELDAEDKKAKKKKEKTPKPKKEKKPKKIKSQEEIEAERRAERHAIGKKGIVATLLLCASFLGLILVATYFVPRQLSLVSARVAFYEQNYEEVVMRMGGRELNESDKIMYQKSSILFGLQERYHQYEIYVQRGMSKEALNALFQGVIASDKEEILAGQLGIEEEWKLCRDAFVSALMAEYGLNEENISVICALRNPDYTVAVENVLAGRMYDDKTDYGYENSMPEASDENAVDAGDNAASEEESVAEEPDVLNPETLEDLLPEEAELLEQLKQENTENSDVESAAEGSDEKELFSGNINSGTVNFAE